MEGLSDFENAVLIKLLAGDHPILETLRSQAEKAYMASRTYTGAGFYHKFMVPSDVALLTSHPDFEIGDVIARIDGLEHGAGFIIFIRSGRLDTLEGYSYDEPWPTAIRNFKLIYVRMPRILDLPHV